MTTVQASPARFAIPPDAEWTRCKSCGVAITFVKTERGHLMPVTQEGTSHFADCPDARLYRKRRR